MSQAIATTRSSSAAPRSVAQGGIGGWLSDAWQMTLRNILHTVRSPELILYAVIQPLIFILMFVYVLGGAMNIPDYAQFLLPGIFVQMVIFGAVAGTTVGTATDIKTGLMDRFRSMPMYRSAVVTGKTFAELGRSLVAIVVMTVMALIAGFRFESGLASALAAFLLLLLFGYALSWLATFIGMSASTPEAAQTVGTMWLFPFSFISSAFVPPESMPVWLRWFAEYSPMTAAVDSMRALFNGTDPGTSILQTVIWSLALIAIFAPLSVRTFGRRA